MHNKISFFLLYYFNSREIAFQFLEMILFGSISAFLPHYKISNENFSISKRHLCLSQNFSIFIELKFWYSIRATFAKIINWYDKELFPSPRNDYCCKPKLYSYSICSIAKLLLLQHIFTFFSREHSKI